ncbi:MAG: XTP/dITP diphosphatase [Candidatus Sifarchaeia archaeon]|jgi:XTP/dITP diphosphohydrolase
MLFLVTSNLGKFKEAKLVMERYGVTIQHLAIEKPEIQADSIKEISEHAAKVILKQYNKEILVEDAGLFVEALNGFPGPYSSYVMRTIGCQGILRLLKNETKRTAKFKAVLSYGKPEESVVSFTGEIKGMITHSIRGNSGFGFDPIFIPEGSNKTFAEMSISEKNEFSHRMRALKQFTDWYTKKMQ